MLVQHFNSWKVRYVTGMAKPDDAEETLTESKLQLRQDDILVGEGEGMKFGTLDETELAGFIAAHEADVKPWPRRVRPRPTSSRPDGSTSQC
jgi:hypothetical protein